MRNCLVLSEENCKLIKQSIRKHNLFKAIESVAHPAPNKLAQPLQEGVGTCQTGQPAPEVERSLSIGVYFIYFVTI